MSRLLIVEDEGQIADLVREVCEDEGYAVLVATNGQEALALMERGPPDLVLSDVMMPVLDERALARMLHAHPVYRTIPDHPDECRSRYAGGGCAHTAFLSKPFSIDQLLFTLALYLPAP